MYSLLFNRVSLSPHINPDELSQHNLVFHRIFEYTSLSIGPLLLCLDQRLLFLGEMPLSDAM